MKKDKLNNNENDSALDWENQPCTSLTHEIWEGEKWVIQPLTNGGCKELFAEMSKPESGAVFQVRDSRLKVPIKTRKPRNYRCEISSVEDEEIILLTDGEDRHIYLHQVWGFQGEQMGSIALTLEEAKELLYRLPEAIQARVKIDKFQKEKSNFA